MTSMGMLISSRSTYRAPSVTDTAASTTLPARAMAAPSASSSAGPRDEGASKRMSTPMASGRPVRSEEHTSELQSHLNLVCRLLLEKKKSQHESLRPDQKTKRAVR